MRQQLVLKFDMNKQCQVVANERRQGRKRESAVAVAKGQTPSYFLFLLALEKRPNYIISKVNRALF